jgi:hypothetical protein
MNNKFKKIGISALAASLVGFSAPTMMTAEAATITVGDVTVSSTDKNGASGGALVATDDYVFNNAAGAINTGTDALTIKSTNSTTADTTLTLSGTGGLVISTDVDSTLSFFVTVNDSNSISIGGDVTVESGKAVTFDLATNSSLSMTGSSKTQAGAITADVDGDGTVTYSGTITQSGTVGAATLDMGIINVSGASTISGVAHSKDVNITANADFSGNLFANTIDLTGTGTDTTTFTAGGTLGKASGTTSVVTMNATGQKVIYDAATAISSDTTVVTDGFGEVEITGSATIVGDIGSSTTLKVGTVDVNVDAAVQNMVFADATTIANTKTLTISGAVADIVYTGTIAGDAAGQGTLVVNNTANQANAINFTGAVGSTELAAITLTTDADFQSTVTADAITVASGKIGTFLGDVTVGAADLTATGTALFSGTTGQTIVGGAANEEIDGTGTISVTNASTAGVTFSTHATLDANTLVLSVSGTGARAIMTQDAHTVEEVSLGDGAILRLDDTIVDAETVFTTTTAQDAASVHASSVIKAPANLDNGETIVLFKTIQTSSTNETDLRDDVNSAFLDNALTDYVATVTSDDITITASNKSETTTGSEISVTVNEARALMQIKESFVANSAGDLDYITELLTSENGRSSGDVAALARQAAPQNAVIAGSTTASKAMTGAVQGVISNRLASLRSGDAYVAGMSAGEGMSANSAFLQAFGTVVDQDDTQVKSGTQAGYDADTSGVAIGFDGITDGGLVVGLSVSMATTDLNGKGTQNVKNDISSYTASIYMDKATDKGYVEGSVTFGLNENDASRVINTAGLNRTYTSEYDTQQVSVKIGGGLPYEANNGSFVTPFASVTGTLIETDAYTETSNTADDALRLRVAQDDVNSIKGSIGIKAHKDTGNGIPMISLALNNEFGDGEIVSNNTYQGGGTKFKTQTAVEEVSATLGLGYTFTNGNTDINVGYEAEANNDDYLGYYGIVKFLIKF